MRLKFAIVSFFMIVSCKRAPDLATFYPVPDFALTERSGKTIRRSDLLGKVSVVDFFYTRCTDACPLQSAHLALVQARFSGARDLRLVSITVDPDYDTPAVLRSYAARVGADPGRWLFLTGPRAAIYQLAVDGFHLAAVTSRLPTPSPPWAWMRPASAWAQAKGASPQILQLVHASWFALVDRRGQIRGYFEGVDGDSVKSLQQQLARRLRER